MKKVGKANEKNIESDNLGINPYGQHYSVQSHSISKHNGNMQLTNMCDEDDRSAYENESDQSITSNLNEK